MVDNCVSKSSNSSNFRNVIKGDTVYVFKKASSSDNISFSKKEVIDLLLARDTTDNALSIFITALGVLFTIMAIVIAIVIFMQSRDFKIKLTEATDKYQQIIKQFIDSKRGDLETQEEIITRLISDYTKQLETPRTEPKQEPDQVEESKPSKEFQQVQESESSIKKIIDGLEHKKNIIEKQLNNSIVEVNYVARNSFLSGKPSSLPNIHHQCSSCKFGFLVPNIDSNTDTFSGSTRMYTGMFDVPNTQKVVKCPKCGNVDVLY